MTADERREYNKEQSKKVREWQRHNPKRMCYNAMMELARRTNCLVIPDIPDTRAALEGVNAQCAKIVAEARARKKFIFASIHIRVIARYIHGHKEDKSRDQNRYSTIKIAFIDT